MRAREEGEKTMVERPYKCPLCHASFRNESGMMWHITHRHEAPQALEALGKNYEEKLEELRNENATQAREIKDLKAQLDDAMVKFVNMGLIAIKEREENIRLLLQVRKLEDSKTILLFGSAENTTSPNSESQKSISAPKSP